MRRLRKVRVRLRAKPAPVRVTALAIVAALLLAGCNPVYVARGAWEEGRILWNRKPISNELDSTSLDPDVRAKLQTVLRVREFAAENLGLNVGGAYQTVSTVDQRAIVYVVMAAPRDSLEPYTWWFPIVGAVPYRGYFKQSQAKAEADAMEAAGYDTMVRPAVAFSSLGFFNDPLLSNLLKLDRVELANVIIHELFHRTYYAASDAMFNESAANYIGVSGALDFFAKTEGESSPDAREAREAVADNLAFGRFMLTEEARLLKIYRSGAPSDEILKQREVAFTQIKTDYAQLRMVGLTRFDLDKQPLNNAVLINYLIYFHDLDNFAALQRQNHGDLKATIAEIIAIAKAHPSEPFYAIWETTRSAPPVPRN